jgi:hypothetical protein
VFVVLKPPMGVACGLPHGRLACLLANRPLSIRRAQHYAAPGTPLASLSRSSPTSNHPEFFNYPLKSSAFQCISLTRTFHPKLPALPFAIPAAALIDEVGIRTATTITAVTIDRLHSSQTIASSLGDVLGSFSGHGIPLRCP